MKLEDGRPSPITLGGSVLATVLTLLNAKLNELMWNACEVTCPRAAKGKHYVLYVISEIGRKLQSNSASIHLESRVQGTVLSDSKHKILLLSKLLIEFQVKNWGHTQQTRGPLHLSIFPCETEEEESWRTEYITLLVFIHGSSRSNVVGNIVEIWQYWKEGERGGREEEPHSYCFSSGHRTHTPALPQRLLSSPRRGWYYSKRVSDAFSLLTKPYKKVLPTQGENYSEYTFNSRYFRILKETL